MEREQEDADRDSSATDKEDDADSSGGDADDSSFLELVKGSSKSATRRMSGILIIFNLMPN